MPSRNRAAGKLTLLLFRLDSRKHSVCPLTTGGLILSRVISRSLVDPVVLNPYHTDASEYDWTDHLALQNP
jgi:hypothetical protein